MSVMMNLRRSQMMVTEKVPAANEIWYTSTDGNVVTPYRTNVFGATIVSNTYENGKGVITCDGDVTKIGDYAFYNRSSLASITLPEGVTSIGNSAFRTSKSLASINIPEGVTSIGICTFQECKSLASITLPEGVTSIGNSAFRFCSNLVSVYCKPTTPPSGGTEMFYGYASAFKIYVPKGKLTTYSSALNWSSYKSNMVEYNFN